MTRTHLDGASTLQVHFGPESKKEVRIQRRKFTYLQSELSRWGQNDGLNAISAKQLLLSQVLGDGQTEAKGLARASQITRDDVLSVVDWIETVLLDWEERSDATLTQLGCSRGWNLWEGRELTILDCVVLESGRVRLLSCETGVLLAVIAVVASASLATHVSPSLVASAT